MDMEGYGYAWLNVNRYGWMEMDMDGRRQMHFPKVTKKKAQRPPRAVELSFC